MRERTVAFYEIVASVNGTLHRVAQMPWPDMLSALARTELSGRTWETDSIYVGSVATYDDVDHLLLHKVKDAGDWLSVLNWRTGEFHELESRADQGYLETTVMAFLSFGNVVGLMQGSTSAPTHKSLEIWLNGLKLFPDTSLAVRPLMTRAETERLRTADGASKVEIRLAGNAISALGDRQGRLARALRLAGTEYGDIKVTIIISVPRGGGRSEDRRRLLADLRDIEEVMPEAADRARATLVYAESSGPEYTRLVEFVEHHITAKRYISAVDETGSSVKILSAVHAILDVALQHEEELRRAADVT